MELQAVPEMAVVKNKAITGRRVSRTYHVPKQWHAVEVIDGGVPAVAVCGFAIHRLLGRPWEATPLEARCKRCSKAIADRAPSDEGLSGTPDSDG